MNVLLKIFFMMAGLIVVAPTKLDAAALSDDAIRAQRDRDLGLNSAQIRFRQAAGDKFADLIPVELNQDVSIMIAVVKGDEFMCIRDNKEQRTRVFKRIEPYDGGFKTALGEIIIIGTENPYFNDTNQNTRATASWELRATYPNWGTNLEKHIATHYKLVIMPCFKTILQLQEEYRQRAAEEQERKKAEAIKAAETAAQVKRAADEAAATQTAAAEKQRAEAIALEERKNAAKPEEQNKAPQQSTSLLPNKAAVNYTLIAAGLGISTTAFVKYYLDEQAQYKKDKESAGKDGKTLPPFSTYFWKRLATTFKVSKAVGTLAAGVACCGVYKGLKA